MSTIELKLSLIQKILQLADSETLSLLEGILLLGSQRSKKSSADYNSLPAREATREEAEAIMEFEANPVVATKEEVLEMEQKLGIKLT